MLGVGPIYTSIQVPVSILWKGVHTWQFTKNLGNFTKFAKWINISMYGLTVALNARFANPDPIESRTSISDPDPAESST